MILYLPPSAGIVLQHRAEDKSLAKIWQQPMHHTQLSSLAAKITMRLRQEAGSVSRGWAHTAALAGTTPPG